MIDNFLCRLSRCSGVLLVGMLMACSAKAETPPNFKDKTITIVVGYAAGGSIDVFSRMIAPFMSAHIPGNPTFIVRNIPGAEGVTGMNVFLNHTKPDGLTMLAGASPQVDMLNYRRANSPYDLSRLYVLGGAGRAGSVAIIRKDALDRLYNKASQPVVMGALSGIRSGMQMTLWGGEFLGWNVKWVFGYQTAKALVLALQRDEIDMTSIADVQDIEALKAGGKFTVVAQTGVLQNGVVAPRPAFIGPLITNMMKDKISDPLAQQAFTYSTDLMHIGVFMALQRETPAPMLAVYDKAFHAAMTDPIFKSKVEATGDELLPQSAEDLSDVFTRLGGTSPDVLAYMQTIAKKQGVNLGD